MVKNRVILMLSEASTLVDLNEDETVSVISSIKGIHIFEDIKDFRQINKIKYKLGDLLLMAMIVILKEKCQSFNHIADYIDVNKNEFIKYALIQVNESCPSHDTFRRVFSLLDSDSFYECTISRLYDYLKELEEAKGYRHIAVDGKTVNGTGRVAGSRLERRNANVLNVYEVGTATCLSSEVIDDKTNEIPTAQNVLSLMDLNKTIVTADALHCQSKTTKVIRDKKGHYVLTLRDNMPLLLQEAAAKIDKNKNKLKTKKFNNLKVEIFNLPKDYEYEEFVDIKSYIKMTSNKSNKECIRYFISDLVKIDEIADIINERWLIENDFHKLKDTYINEDTFRCTDKKAIKNMVLMNNLISQLVMIYIPMSSYIPRKAKIAFRSRPEIEILKLLAVLSSDTIKDKLKEAINKTNKK